jgi:hypothetical protein
MARKAQSLKKINGAVAKNTTWAVCQGTSKRAPGRPHNVRSLFKVVAEKIPFDFLPTVRTEMKKLGITANGVYIAHDSMGCPRYVGRGAVFNRLEARRKAQKLELTYFSFYVVENKIHEREVETVMIRAAGPLLAFNNRKKRDDIQAGNIRDFEAGTHFFERQYRKGKRRSGRKPASA